MGRHGWVALGSISAPSFALCELSVWDNGLMCVPSFCALGIGLFSCTPGSAMTGHVLFLLRPYYGGIGLVRTGFWYDHLLLCLTYVFARRSEGVFLVPRCSSLKGAFFICVSSLPSVGVVSYGHKATCVSPSSVSVGRNVAAPGEEQHHHPCTRRVMAAGWRWPCCPRRCDAFLLCFYWSKTSY